MRFVSQLLNDVLPLLWWLVPSSSPLSLVKCPPRLKTLISWTIFIIISSIVFAGVVNGEVSSLELEFGDFEYLPPNDGTSSSTSSTSSITTTTTNNNNSDEVFIRYVHDDGTVHEISRVPKYFTTDLSREDILLELAYFVTHDNTWSERVVLEKMFFALSFATSGWPDTATATETETETSLSSSSSPSSSPASSASSTNTKNNSNSNKNNKNNKLPTYWDIFQHNRTTDYCDWIGITCSHYGSIAQPQLQQVTIRDNRHDDIIQRINTHPKVTDIQFHNFGLAGTLPRDLTSLKYLTLLDVKSNALTGTIPISYGTKLSNLQTLCLANNQLQGTIPKSFQSLKKLQHVWLSNNQLTGTIPEINYNFQSITLLDLANNALTGTLPKSMSKHAANLTNLFLESNRLSGPLWDFQPSTNNNNKQTKKPNKSNALKESLQVIDLGSNHFTGTLPRSWMTELTKLRDLNLAGNSLSGTIPTEILKMSNLEVFILSDNRFTGPIPRGDDVIPSRARLERQKQQQQIDGNHTMTPRIAVGGNWSNLSRLKLIMWNNNELTGPLPPEMLYGLRKSITSLDIGNNTLTGTIPHEIGKLSKLERIDAMSNKFTGVLPDEMNKMDPNLELNFTNNFLVGTVPKMFCGGGSSSTNLLYRQFACDAVLCPAGTFHPSGAATLQSGCRPCPVSIDQRDHDPPLYKVLGRTICTRTVKFVHGDLNGDGVLSPREILRLLFVDTIGRNWGDKFQTWGDVNVNECGLVGIECVSGVVAKIDLTDAALCSNGERKAGPIHECKGIPAEIGQLRTLEVLVLNKRQFLRGTIPTEVGKMTRLKYLDLSTCPLIIGTIPSELGRLRKLKYLNFGGCRLNGTVPSELFELTNLEKLHLSMNPLTGTLPTNIGQLKRIKELMFSRTYLGGSLPEHFGQISTLENLEMYGNQLVGNIPESLGNFTGLKRIDLFNNHLSGTIPESLTQLRSLQILHVKLNQLTGTISPNFGELPYLTWFDVSGNKLHGTIPHTFGSSRSIQDFRLGDNMIYEPIPLSLCANSNVNGGLARMYGCDGVICPLGTYSDSGHATLADGCKPCPEGQTTMYLGSSTCQTFSQEDMLSMLFEVLKGDSWGKAHKKNWKNQRVHVCEWAGISCDDNKEITSLKLPIRNANPISE